MEHKLTWALIIANIVIFELVFSLPQTQIEDMINLLSFSFDTKFEIWRWFTSMFMHASASHLFLNMLGVYFFGKILEKEVKAQWFVAIYFASGLMGNLVFMFTSLNPVIGASGAMFGIMGAVMLLNPIKKTHLYVFPLPAGLVAILFAIVEAILLSVQPSFDNVAHIAHIGGLLTGAIFAFFFSPKTAAKGIIFVIFAILIIIILGPIFGIITGIGGFILQIVDTVVGFVLYGIANVIGAILWG